MRKAQISRKTTETDIRLELSLDGTGSYRVKSGSGFFDHMLEQLARHARFDLTLDCAGDTEVDMHHSVEDTGICLGEAVAKALGDKKGIRRYGHIVLPMDEALILCAADISGRSYLNFDLDIPSEKIGTFDTELTEEFFQAFVRNFPITLHIKQLEGKNSHHIVEGTFKAFARTMQAALETDRKYADEIPSTKGVL